MNAMRSWSFGDSLSAWLPNNRIVGLLKLKVRKILDTTYRYSSPGGISLIIVGDMLLVNMLVWYCSNALQ